MSHAALSGTGDGGTAQFNVNSVPELLSALERGGPEVDLGWSGPWNVALEHGWEGPVLAELRDKSSLSLGLFPPKLSVALLRGAGRCPGLKRLAVTCKAGFDDFDPDDDVDHNEGGEVAPLANNVEVSAVAVAVAEAIEESTGLQSCKLDFMDPEVGDEAGQRLIKALASSTSLTDVDFRASEGMGDATGAALAETLRTSPALQRCSLVLTCSRMGDQTGIVLAEALGANDSLEAFGLSAAEQMGDATGMAIAEALKASSTLLSFSIDALHAEATDRTGVAFGKALAQNSLLRTFAFGPSCQMAEETARALAEAVRQNRTLRSLVAPGCAIPACLREAFAGNFSLIELCLDGGEFGGHIERRNHAILQFRTLASLAREARGAGVRVLTFRSLRRTLLRFLLPADLSRT